MKAILRNGIPEPVNSAFIDNNGIWHPRDVLRLWTAEELASIDVYTVIDAPVPQGHVITDASLEWDGTAVTRVFRHQTPQAACYDEQKARRREDFVVQADPIYMKWQRGEATKQQWLDKVQEIRDRYPYPEA